MDETIQSALAVFPPDDYPLFTLEEFSNRVEAARLVMQKLEIDALLVTSEANFRYMTGYILQSPVQIARPRYFVLPLEGAPCAVVPRTNVDGMRQTTWLDDIRSWVAPCPEDDGVSLVADALRAAPRRFGRLGAEIGAEARLGMPVLDYMRLIELLAPLRFVDGEAVFRRIRMVKSPAEIDRIRRIARIVSASFDTLPGLLHIGDTEWSACRRMQLDLVLRGAHRTPHLMGVSGQGGYTNINTGPTGRALESGSVLTIDAGCCFDNYWCDFNRNFGFGRVGREAIRAYEALHAATEAGLGAVRPGVRTRDLFAAMAGVLRDAGAPGSTVGRMGHGIGLLAPEPPSINAADDTVLEPGMVLTLEPSLSFTVEGQARIMAHEENLAVTEDGCELLTTRAPRDMPVVN
jgi:Xaa-Pro dipeptidase